MNVFPDLFKGVSYNLPVDEYATEDPLRPDDHLSFRDFMDCEETQQWGDYSRYYPVATDAIPAEWTDSSLSTAESVDSEATCSTQSSIYNSSRSSTSEKVTEDDDHMFPCPVKGCGRKYKHKGDLKTHVQKRHSENRDLPSTISRPRSTKSDKVFPCPMEDCICGYDRHRDLLRHYRLKHHELYEETLKEKEQKMFEHEAKLKVKFDKESNHSDFRSMVSVMTF